MHPDDKAYGRTALIIRSDIKHYGISKFQREFLQTTSIVAKDQNGCIIISVIYSSPKHIIKNTIYSFFKTLGNRFIAAGDYNVKHIHWGSILILPEGRELLKAIKAVNLATLSTGEPTGHPTIKRLLIY